MLQFCVAIKYSLQVSLDDVNIQQFITVDFLSFNDICVITKF